MKEKFNFRKGSPLRLVEEGKKGVFNFENMYSLYLFVKEPLFRKEISKKHNFTYPDGKNLSRYLKTKQVRGPTFTKRFLLSNFAKDKRHLFMGDPRIKKEMISKKTGIKEESLEFYAPAYIKGVIEFSKKDKEEMVKVAKKFRPDYVWICVGNPKQEILANQLFEMYPSTYLSVGAALDFLIGDKSEAPAFFRLLGLEWLYRLVCDFKYTKKKAWYSFVALKYLKYVSLV